MRWNLEYVRWKLKNFIEGVFIGGGIGTRENPKTFVGSPHIIDVHKGRQPLEKDVLYYYDNAEITKTAKIMANDLNVELISVDRCK